MQAWCVFSVQDRWCHPAQAWHVFFSVQDTMVPPRNIELYMGLVCVFSPIYDGPTQYTQFRFGAYFQPKTQWSHPLHLTLYMDLVCVFSPRHNGPTQYTLQNYMDLVCNFSPRCSDHSTHPQLHEQAGEHIRCGHRECKQRVLHLLQRGLWVPGTSCSGHRTGPRLSENEESVHHRLWLQVSWLMLHTANTVQFARCVIRITWTAELAKRRKISKKSLLKKIISLSVKVMEQNLEAWNMFCCCCCCFLWGFSYSDFLFSVGLEVTNSRYSS